MMTSAELLARAVHSHQSGNLPQAEALYRQILQADPAHATAHHMLGLLAHQAGRPETAIQLIRQALALNPAERGCHFNLAVVFMSQGQAAQAIACYRQALRLEPHNAQAHNNLGNALRSQGQLAEAIQCYRQALASDPRSANAHYNLGNALKDDGNLAEAVACYRQALASNPQHAGAHNNLGVILKSQGNLAEAVACYRQALACDPRHADAHNNLGSALNEQGQWPEAAACLRQALAIDPRHADATVNLGNVLQRQGQLAEAMACYRQALAINPQHADAYTNLGRALKEQGEFVEAIECYRQAVRLGPRQAEPYHNLSIAVTPFGLLGEALEHNEHALRIDPAHTAALWQRSLLRLLHGDFERGWLDYEQRWAQPNIVTRSFPQPRWDGSSLEGKTIFVHAEQGLGDTIQFIRYLPLVKARGGTVLFACTPGLDRLLTGTAGIDQLVVAGTPLPAFDVYVPLLSLPGIFGTTLATIPAPVPYVRADPALAAHWKAELEPLGGFKVGIAWQGSPKNSGDRYRSVALTRFESLARVSGVRLVSLQKGPGTEQFQGWAGRITRPSDMERAPRAAGEFPLLDLSDRIDLAGAFVDTAALIQNLDLVVTVDSAVAHLAGALGVPVWVVLPLTPDWRWLLDRSDSPWYPTMRLFRQKRFGDWDEVFERVGAELVDLRVRVSPGT